MLNLITANVPRKVKDRAEVIRLNAHGWYVEKIAAHFDWTAQTVRFVLHKWRNLGLEKFSALTLLDNWHKAVYHSSLMPIILDLLYSKIRH
ncbi:helix-turn-helix domain-containing protein [Nostoc sp.]|uniref:helix-turn-helix domain-containing protein n=1 Tax=Nostoc sp. TaxID=1180 RepID=UPI003FA5AA36